MRAARIKLQGLHFAIGTVKEGAAVPGRHGFWLSALSAAMSLRHDAEPMPFAMLQDKPAAFTQEKNYYYAKAPETRRST